MSTAILNQTNNDRLTQHFKAEEFRCKDKTKEFLWGMGQIQIAQAVPETYRYVAGYVTKKMYEIDGKKANAYYELGQTKPFACMSLKPGLGIS